MRTRSWRLVGFALPRLECGLTPSMATRWVSLILVAGAVSWPSLGGETGHIQFKCPPGIQLFLDGTLEGLSSTDVGGLILQDVPAGKHTIKAIQSGFQPQIQTVYVRPHKVLVVEFTRFIPKIEIVQRGEMVEKTIKRKYGSLILQSLPVECQVECQTLGISTKKTGDEMELPKVPTGIYTFRLSAMGKDLTHQVSIENGKTTKLLFNLVSLKIEDIAEKERAEALRKLDADRLRARQETERRRLANRRYAAALVRGEALFDQMKLPEAIGTFKAAERIPGCSDVSEATKMRRAAERLYEKYKHYFEVDTRQRDKDGRTPLIIAARNTDVNAARILIRRGSDTNAANKYGRTPLHAAAGRGGNLEMVEMLLKNGANVNAKCDDGVTPLMVAVMSDKGGDDTVELLISSGASVNSVCNGGVSALVYAVTLHANVECTKVLLKNGADANITFKAGKETHTPLSYAIGSRDSHWTTEREYAERNAAIVRLLRRY